MFGESATVGAALWTYAWLTNNAKWWQFLGGMGVAASCLVLSDSSTSIMGSVIIVALEFALIRPKVQSSGVTPVLIVLLLGAIGFYSAAALNMIPGLDALLEPITKSVGKDTSFSGRSLIWEVVENHIAQNPVRGTGYGAYFIGPIPSSPSYEFVLRKIGYPPEAHNGYLEVTNDLGFLGLFCLFGFIIVYLRQCFYFLRSYPQPVLWIGLLVSQMIGNTTESIWFQSSSLPFVVLTAITFDMARMRVEQEFRKGPATHRGRNLS